MDTRRPSERRESELHERRQSEYQTGVRVIKKWALISTGVVSALIVGGTLLGMFYTIDEYERGVLTRNGAFVKILNPGWGMKAPWIEEISERADLRVKTYVWPNMESYTADSQKAFLKISATLRPRESRLEQLYKQHRTTKSAVQELLSPLMNKDAKIVFGGYTSTSAIVDRGKLNSDIEDKIKQGLGLDTVLDIIGIQVEDIAFSKEYIESVENRMKAQIDVEKHRQELEKEKVSADIKKTQATAEAFRIQSIGNAEAEAIRAKSKAMFENPSYIQLLQAERWDGKLPNTMLPNQTIPIIEMTNKK